MRLFCNLLRDCRATAAAEMALITPLMLALLLGSVEVSNYFLNQHAVSKAVRDGARYASRMTLAGATYECPDQVFEDAAFDVTVKNVVKTGSVDGSATGRFPDSVWTSSCADGTALDVSVRCVAKGDYAGIYTGLDGDIPVVKVSANITYPSVLGTLGLTAAPSLCLSAESESAVAGL